jgi:hypothetical protein
MCGLLCVPRALMHHDGRCSREHEAGEKTWQQRCSAAEQRATQRTEEVQDLSQLVAKLQRFVNTAAVQPAPLTSMFMNRQLGDAVTEGAAAASKAGSAEESLETAQRSLQETQEQLRCDG